MKKIIGLDGRPSPTFFGTRQVLGHWETLVVGGFYVFTKITAALKPYFDW